MSTVAAIGAQWAPRTREEALRIANLLDRASAALWRTHGDAMADLLACLDPEAAMSTHPEDAPGAARSDHRSADEPF